MKPSGMSVAAGRRLDAVIADRPAADSPSGSPSMSTPWERQWI